jgi:hypothetical protein
MLRIAQILTLYVILTVVAQAQTTITIRGRNFSGQPVPFVNLSNGTTRTLASALAAFPGPFVISNCNFAMPNAVYWPLHSNFIGWPLDIPTTATFIECNLKNRRLPAGCKTVGCMTAITRQLANTTETLIVNGEAQDVTIYRTAIYGRHSPENGRTPIWLPLARHIAKRPPRGSKAALQREIYEREQEAVAAVAKAREEWNATAEGVDP